MQAVYFWKELHERAPHVVGCLCAAPKEEWISLAEIAEAMDRGESISIRPATPSELKRAADLIACSEAGDEMGTKMDVLFERSPQEEVGTARELVSAIFSSIPFSLLD